MRVPVSQEAGAARQSQKPEQYPDCQPIRSTEGEGLVQRFVKRRAFLDPLDGLRQESESAFGTGDAPASQFASGIPEGFNNRIRQRRGQGLALIPADIEETLATAGIVPKAKLTVWSAGLDAKDF